MLVRQFRMAPYLAEGVTEMLEVCAGMLDGDAPEVGAKREVIRGDGRRGAASFVHAFDAFMSPGGDHRAHLLLHRAIFAARTASTRGAASTPTNISR